jgi:TM2 domain-containing membrane protein YozV
MVKQCTGCGAQIEDQVRFCSYCGTENQDVHVQQQTTNYSAPPQYQQNISYADRGYSNQTQPQYHASQPQYGYPPQQPINNKPKKDKTVAALLAFFLGWIGIHKFYMNQIGSGVMYLLFCWTGIPAILAFIEFIMYLVDSDESFQRRIPA